MKKIFKEKIHLSIHTTDSEEALKYNFKSSTNVLFEKELVPLETALDKNKMNDFLTEKIH